jgi:hypothetical protein
MSAMRTRPDKIISGGQTGADRAGLDAAVILKIPTGGHAPLNYRTEAGEDWELATFGIEQTTTRQYIPRTILNVTGSHATVIFATHLDEGSGETLRFCKIHNKPTIVNPTAAQLRAWIGFMNVRILNVAGNRESKDPGIRARVTALLVEAFAK